MKLSERHKSFCDEYLSNGMNGTKAYQSVYKVGDKVAEASASRLLLNVRIKEYLQQQQEKTAKRLQITKEGLLQDLLQIKDNNKGVRDSISMKAIEIINKMSGFDSPIKQEITIKEEPPLFSDDDIIE